VHERLLIEFMSGMRPPGQPLNIEKLARELNMSPTPVREALARLEHTGLVSREALRGYHVAPLLSRNEILQLMDARLLLEPTLAANTTHHATQQFLEQLASTIDTMDSASKTVDGKALRKAWMADEAFHSLISQRAGNPFMDRAYQSLGGQLQRFRLLGESGTTHADTAAREHERIYEAIAAVDSDGAFQAMQAHLENAKSRALHDQLRATRQETDITPRDISATSQ
jgi:DNA-binding GntR family transcriptional regulator